MNDDRKNILKPVMVFLIFFAVFVLIQASIKNFLGYDDPYYHAKHSWLIEQTLNLTLVGPWIKYNFLSYTPTDPWWGYHLAGASFIHFFGPIWGMKALAALLAALVFSLFYWILYDLKIKKIFIWTALFFFSSPMFFVRLLLARPLVLAMIFAPLAFWLMLRKKYVLLFITSAVYVLFYNQAPMLLFFLTAFTLSEYISEKKINLRYLISVGAGLLLGILIHPHSLNYMFVIFVHFFKVVELKFQGIDLGIASELQSINFSDTILYNLLAVASFVISVTIYLSMKKIRLSADKLGGLPLFLISIFWFIVVLFMPRGIDYWIPFSWIFVAVVISSFVGSEDYLLARDFISKKINFKISTYVLVVACAALMLNNCYWVYKEIDKENRDTLDSSLAQAATWLDTNTPKDSVIFYNKWAYWPTLFFYDDSNKYIIGFDPTFLYEYDHQLFWIWKNISKNGYYCDKIDECPSESPKKSIEMVKYGIQQKLGSDYVLINNDRRANLYKTLENGRKNFKKIYENKDILIYQVI